MIIPVKCFTCGNVLANKYRYYQIEVRKRKLAKKTANDASDIDKVVYLTKEFHEKTPEGEVLDELNMTKMCCRRHFLTHVDID
jgi:DNA-directed RNA polymerase I, II, and III subunit RPABC5